jgi:hypothetical protein
LKKALSFDPDNPQASKLWKTAKMMDALKQVRARITGIERPLGRERV